MKILNKLEHCNNLVLKTLLNYKYSFTVFTIVGLLSLMNLNKFEKLVENYETRHTHTYSILVVNFKF